MPDLVLSVRRRKVGAIICRIKMSVPVLSRFISLTSSIVAKFNGSFLFPLYVLLLLNFPPQRPQKTLNYDGKEIRI